MMEDKEGPFGLLNEPWVPRNLRDNGFCCLNCGNGLEPGGGASTAWADVLCSSATCNTFFEVKTRNRRNPEMRRGYYIEHGGSHRWFHAQRNGGVRHYLIYV